MKMAEFTLRAVLIGLVMTVVLGAANAYLGLRAGQTIAATYPAAVIGMAILRIFRGSILEENMARTVGSIGESVAAGAIFTIPAFVIVKAWPAFDTPEAYWQSTALMLVGGTLGILFVTLLRRVMVEDPELPFPESSAAAEIHKAGQGGSDAANTLFKAMGIGGFTYLLGELKLFSASKDFLIGVGELGKSTIKLGADRVLAVGGFSKFSLPAISPAYLGVGYIIGPKLGALNFAGGLLAWGLMVPLLTYFLGPEIGLFDDPMIPTRLPETAAKKKPSTIITVAATTAARMDPAKKLYSAIMAANVAPRPRKTVLNEMSISVRFCAAVCPLAFFRSFTARPMPCASELRILNMV